MKNLLPTAALVVVSTLCCASAQAQFSFPAIPGIAKLTGGGGGGASADLGGQQDTLIRGFVAANKDVLTANARLSDALGMKQQAAKLQETANSLTEGSTRDSLEAANLEVAVSTDAVAAEMAKKPVLDANSKAIFATGLTSLAAGAGKYLVVGRNVKDMGAGLSGASPLQLPKLQPAIFVVQNFPASMGRVSDALQNVVAFARSAGVPVADDATAFLASRK